MYCSKGAYAKDIFIYEKMCGDEFVKMWVKEKLLFLLYKCEVVKDSLAVDLRYIRNHLIL